MGLQNVKRLGVWFSYNGQQVQGWNYFSDPEFWTIPVSGPTTVFIK